jgi:hypothetical protein
VLPCFGVPPLTREFCVLRPRRALCCVLLPGASGVGAAALCPSGTIVKRRRESQIQQPQAISAVAC